MKEFLEKLRSHRLYGPLVQFLRFGAVGVSNTVVAYAVEMLCYYVIFASAPMEERTRVALVNALAFIASTLNSYYWNNRFVFGGGEKKTAGEHLRAYLRMAACYALTGLVLAPWAKLTLSARGVPYWAASISTLVVTIPLNFLLNKFWAFRKKQ
ncbi:MAG: GtrA family protein [Clostridia bacterium]|nr:GtrA family protein [Clostridia bacterium]